MNRKYELGKRVVGIEGWIGEPRKGKLMREVTREVDREVVDIKVVDREFGGYNGICGRGGWGSGVWEDGGQGSDGYEVADWEVVNREE